MYSEMFELHAAILKALAHPRRLEIVHLLREQELTVSDIYEMLDLPQANISQHLTILRESNIVSTRREGKQIFYTLTDHRYVEASDLLRETLVDYYKNSELANHLTLKMKDLIPIVHDPVCHMRVSPRTAGFHANHAGKPYYFCASGCLKKFEEHPEEYATQ